MSGVEDDLPMIDRQIEQGPQDRHIGTDPCRFAVDALNDNAAQRLKAPVQQVMQKFKRGRDGGIIRGNMKREPLSILLGYQNDNTAPINQMGPCQALGDSSLQ